MYEEDSSVTILIIMTFFYTIHDCNIMIIQSLDINLTSTSLHTYALCIVNTAKYIFHSSQNRNSIPCTYNSHATYSYPSLRIHYPSLSLSLSSCVCACSNFSYAFSNLTPDNPYCSRRSVDTHHTDCLEDCHKP